MLLIIFFAAVVYQERLVQADKSQLPLQKFSISIHHQHSQGTGILKKKFIKFISTFHHILQFLPSIL